MATLLTDAFTGTNGAAWDATKWTTSASGITLDINTNRGRSDDSGFTANDYGRATAVMTDNANTDLLLSLIEPTSNLSGATFNAFVDSNFSGAGKIGTVLTSGVYVRWAMTTAPSVTLFAKGSGVAAISATAFTYTFGTAGAVHWVRLRRDGNTAYVRIWANGSTEPTTWQATLDITGKTIPAGKAGVERENTSSSGISGASYVDDVTISSIAALDGGYTAQAMTGSAAMPNGVPGIGKTYSATAMFGSADTPAAIGLGNTQRLDVTADGMGGQSGTATTATFTTAASTPILLKFSALAGNEYEASRTLYLDTSNANMTATFTVYRLNADWSEATIGTSPSRTSVRTVTATSDAAGLFVIDISGADIGYGVGIITPGGPGPTNLTVSSRENATPTNRPYAIATTAPQASASYTAQVSTASGAMADPVTSTTRSVSASGQPMTASADLANAVGAGDVHIDANAAAEPAAAFVDLAQDSHFALPVEVAATVLTASGAAVTPQAGTTNGVAFDADPITVDARWVRPTVNGGIIALSEDEDKYFARVMADSPFIWFRLNDQGSTAADRAGLLSTHGNYVGVQTGQFNAPEQRHSVHFNGSAYIQQVPEADGIGALNGVFLSALEFSFRTTQTDSFLMVTADSGPERAKEVFLRNGRIAYKTHFGTDSLGHLREPVEFRGFKNLADGEWHHVVIRGGTFRFQERGVEVWVDGKLEVRRVSANAMIGFPDFIGSRPAELRGYNLGALSGSLNFIGDMSEVVFYGHDLNDDSIPRHYYAFMGWTPIEAKPLEGFAFTPSGHTGKGNQKRALYLWWSTERDAYNIGGDGNNGKMNFDPIPWAGRPYSGIVDYGGYKVFMRSATAGPIGDPTYRDEMTDAPTIIDLKRHVDLNDYDVIMFGDWPDEGTDFDGLREVFPDFDRAYERLIGQLRDANDAGVGLFITQPRLAIDLGIMDRVEFVPTNREFRSVTGQGNAAGLYDYGSAYKFPWNIRGASGMEGNPGFLGSPFNGQPVNRDPVFLRSKAFYYGDTNKNDRFRVRAVIDGLTSIPSYMIQDAVYQKDYDVWGWLGAAYKYIHRLDGMRIGDEYLFHGTDFGQDYDAMSADFTDVRFGRWFGYFATPIEHVKAGTVVTTFGAKTWEGEVELDNPYRNYATTIVLQPGDVLAGRSVGGKIYVNFTEQPSRQREYVLVQHLPENGVYPNQYVPDTAEQKTWEYSWTRTSLTSTNAQNQTISYVDPLGNEITVQTKGLQLSMVRSSEIFPLDAFPSYNMNTRGLFWLRDSVEVNDGDKTIAAAPLTATATTVNAVAVAQRDAAVHVEAMVGLVQAPKVREDSTGEVEIRTLPMTASAAFTGFSKVISAEPMTAEAVLVENFDAVHTTGEQVVLTIHYRDVTLYLKEDA